MPFYIHFHFSKMQDIPSEEHYVIENVLYSKGINEPAHEIMVLITKATNEGSDEPVHPRSLARAFAVRTHEVWK